MDPKNENSLSSSDEASERSERSECSSASDHEDCPTCSEEESMSEDETPTTSDIEFIDDSEIEEADLMDEMAGDIEDLKKENQVLKTELKKQSQLIWELSQG